MQAPAVAGTLPSGPSEVPQGRPAIAHLNSFSFASSARTALQPSLELAEASTSEPAGQAAPGDKELQKSVNRGSRKLRELLEQDQYEEVYSGALDGLSGADIAPVVEELENVVGGLVRLFTETLPNLAGRVFRPADASSAVMGSSGLTQGWMTGSLDLAQLASPMGFPKQSFNSSAAALHRTADGQGSPSHAALREGVSEGSTASSCMESILQPQLLQVGMHLPSGLFTADISFTAAATNAVSAAVNVNNQVENMLVPLRQAAADMRSIISQITDLAASIDKYESAAQVERESLAKSADTLHNILGTATDRVLASNSGLPSLIAQLQTAVTQLRDANNSASRADAAKYQKLVSTLEGAVAALSDASVSLDVRGRLEAAKDKVQEGGKTKQAEPVAGTAERVVDPAVQGIDKAVVRLQDALSDLDIAVNAARGLKADAAPPVKD